MTRILAKAAIIVAIGVSTLGNYWFTFGIWPKSWWSFVGFILLGIVLFILNEAIDQEHKQ